MTNSAPSKRSSERSVNFGESARSSASDAHTKNFGPHHQPTIFKMDLEPQRQTEVYTPSPESMKVRNVVIFGDSGVGKSSLINMLAGFKTAATSSGVLGCTFQSNQYNISVNGERVNVWDTAGLDEGTRGRVPPEVAERNLTKLLRELRSANGIHLLVYCIRGPGIRKSLARNYTIFYSAICRKKVPIVAVVTGLENEPNSMDDWWVRGEKELARYKMRFDAHACVTTIDMEKFAGSVFEERSKASQELVRNLILSYSRRVDSQPPADTNVFIKAALVDFRSMMKSGWENAVQPASNVVFYQTDISLFHSGLFGDLKRINSHINGRSFIFQHAGDLSERYITPRISRGAADLLIFSGRITDGNVDKLRKFYSSCGGEICPLLVVTDDQSIDGWKAQLDVLGVSGHVTSMTSTPRGCLARADLWSLVDELCLVRGSAKYRRANLLRFFMRRSRENEGNDEMEIIAPPK